MRVRSGYARCFRPGPGNTSCSLAMQSVSAHQYSLYRQLSSRLLHRRRQHLCKVTHPRSTRSHSLDRCHWGILHSSPFSNILEEQQKSAGPVGHAAGASASTAAGDSGICKTKLTKQLPAGHKGCNSSYSAENMMLCAEQAVLVQYVVLRADLWKEMDWPLGSIVAQACHAATAALWESREAESSKRYCSSGQLDHMHKVGTCDCVVVHRQSQQQRYLVHIIQ